MQLAELVRSGDELADSGLLLMQQQGRDEIINAVEELMQVLNWNRIDTENFPHPERDHD